MAKNDDKKKVEKATTKTQTAEKSKKASADILEKKKVTPHADCQWYVLNTRSGYENSVAKAVRQRVEATGLEEMIPEVLVPVQKKVVVKNGKQEIKEEKIYPGYVLMNMVLNQNTWSIISSTEGLRGFVKTDKEPRPLSKREVEAIMQFMEVEQPAYQASFSVGEAVKIIDGPLTDMIGNVTDIDESSGKVTVMISFLGREAPYKLDFSQVSKL